MKHKIAAIRKMCKYENVKLLRAAHNLCHQMQFGSVPNATTNAQFIQAANRAQFADAIMQELERPS